MRRDLSEEIRLVNGYIDLVEGQDEYRRTPPMDPRLNPGFAALGRAEQQAALEAYSASPVRAVHQHHRVLVQAHNQLLIVQARESGTPLPGLRTGLGLNNTNAAERLQAIKWAQCGHAKGPYGERGLIGQAIAALENDDNFIFLSGEQEEARQAAKQALEAASAKIDKLEKPEDLPAIQQALEEAHRALAAADALDGWFADPSPINPAQQTEFIQAFEDTNLYLGHAHYTAEQVAGDAMRAINAARGDTHMPEAFKAAEKALAEETNQSRYTSLMADLHDPSAKAPDLATEPPKNALQPRFLYQQKQGRKEKLDKVKEKVEEKVEEAKRPTVNKILNDYDEDCDKLVNHHMQRARPVAAAINAQLVVAHTDSTGAINRANGALKKAQDGIRADLAVDRVARRDQLLQELIGAEVPNPVIASIMKDIDAREQSEAEALKKYHDDQVRAVAANAGRNIGGMMAHRLRTIKNAQESEGTVAVRDPGYVKQSAASYDASAGYVQNPEAAAEDYSPLADGKYSFAIIGSYTGRAHETYDVVLKTHENGQRTVEFSWYPADSLSETRQRIDAALEVAAATGGPVDISNFPPQFTYYSLAWLDSRGVPATYQSASINRVDGSPDGGEKRMAVMRGEIQAGKVVDPSASYASRFVAWLGQVNPFRTMFENFKKDAGLDDFEFHDNIEVPRERISEAPPSPMPVPTGGVGATATEEEELEEELEEGEELDVSGSDIIRHPPHATDPAPGLSEEGIESRDTSDMLGMFGDGDALPSASPLPAPPSEKTTTNGEKGFRAFTTRELSETKANPDDPTYTGGKSIAGPSATG